MYVWKWCQCCPNIFLKFSFHELVLSNVIYIWCCLELIATAGRWTGPQPVRNQAAQEQVSSRQALCSPLLALQPEPPPFPPPLGPWKSCLPWNGSLVPKIWGLLSVIFPSVVGRTGYVQWKLKFLDTFLTIRRADLVWHLQCFQKKVS